MAMYPHAKLQLALSRFYVIFPFRDKFELHVNLGLLSSLGVPIRHLLLISCGKLPRQLRREGSKSHATFSFLVEMELPAAKYCKGACACLPLYRPLLQAQNCWNRSKVKGNEPPMIWNQ